jgi:hypothetical protein
MHLASMLLLLLLQAAWCSFTSMGLYLTFKLCWGGGIMLLYWFECTSHCLVACVWGGGGMCLLAWLGVEPALRNFRVLKQFSIIFHTKLFQGR